MFVAAIFMAIISDDALETFDTFNTNNERTDLHAVIETFNAYFQRKLIQSECFNHGFHLLCSSRSFVLTCVSTASSYKDW